MLKWLDNGQGYLRSFGQRTRDAPHSSIGQARSRTVRTMNKDRSRVSRKSLDDGQRNRLSKRRLSVVQIVKIVQSSSSAESPCKSRRDANSSGALGQKRDGLKELVTVCCRQAYPTWERYLEAFRHGLAWPGPNAEPRGAHVIVLCETVTITLRTHTQLPAAELKTLVRDLAGRDVEQRLRSCDGHRDVAAARPPSSLPTVSLGARRSDRLC